MFFEVISTLGILTDPNLHRCTQHILLYISVVHGTQAFLSSCLATWLASYLGSTRTLKN